MKKVNLNSLKLNKKLISHLNKKEIKGGLNTAGCYTEQICPLPPIETSLPPIENPDPEPIFSIVEAC
ncbi:MAG: hypothetical protein AB8B65_19385 [Kordia sp.]|uniref:hypothetical protein n=1 Tax=Kordia sp. TaxID=1965332 RepID=UPI00385F222C